jgi:hypothetical protein
MKKLLILGLAYILSISVHAQTPKFRFAKVSRDVKKEARKLEKDGWMVFPGAMPIGQQLNNAYTKQTETTEEGYPKWIVANGVSTAQMQAAAEMQAIELAKNNLVGLIETNMRSVVESDVSNNQLSSEDAVSITKTIQVSANKVSKKLGMVQPIFKVYRKLTKEKNIEVQITLAYNYEMAKKALLEEAKFVLQAETDDVRQRYEKYLNPENFNRGDIKNTNQE